MIACAAWLILLFAAATSHRRVLVQDAKRVLTPELLNIQEILKAGIDSGMTQRKDKIEAALHCLDALIVRE